MVIIFMVFTLWFGRSIFKIIGSHSMNVIVKTRGTLVLCIYICSYLDRCECLNE